MPLTRAQSGTRSLCGIEIGTARLADTAISGQQHRKMRTCSDAALFKNRAGWSKPPGYRRGFTGAHFDNFMKEHIALKCSSNGSRLYQYYTIRGPESTRHWHHLQKHRRLQTRT
jgi:hypothetical protein